MAPVGPSYAPYDPTLPKPWKGLVDGKTGNLYFWNPETNVTQYQRPTAERPRSPTLENSEAVGSQQAVIPSSQEQEDRNTNEEDSLCRGNVDKSEKACIPFDGHNPNADDIQCKSPKIEDEKCSEGNFIAADLPHAEVKPTCNSSILFSGASASPPSKSSADLYCKKHEIRVSGGDVPMPFMTFESTKFPQEILRTIHNAGFSAPTPIQAQTWPIALQRRDIIAVAKTGSGKTLGYLIPGFYHVKYLKRNNKMGPTVLILSPTRELATQILDEAEKFGSSSGISCTCLYGGAPKGPQLGALARGTDIVVATPGRLNDILEMKKVSLQQVSYLVLDEADRMLDMGFEPQIRKIVKEITERHQTLMYTATWPREVRKIAADLLVKPVQVNIGNVDELVANKSITQHVKVVASMEKRQCLRQLLRSLQPGRTIIFCSTKKMCDQLAENLDEHFGAAAIHGDKSQGERDNVLNEFRSGKSPILVATDVAARGLDVKDVRVVINYDFPTGIEDYVHRIGRTGRAGASGVAYTFFTDLDAKFASGLVKILEGAGQIVPPELRNMTSYGGGYGVGGQSGQWGAGGGGGGNKWSGGESRSKSNYGSWGGQSSSGGWLDKSESKGFGNNAHQVGNHSYGGNGMRARSRSPVRRGWGGN